VKPDAAVMRKIFASHYVTICYVKVTKASAQRANCGCIRGKHRDFPRKSKIVLHSRRTAWQEIGDEAFYCHREFFNLIPHYGPNVLIFKTAHSCISLFGIRVSSCCIYWDNATCLLLHAAVFLSSARRSACTLLQVRSSTLCILVSDFAFEYYETHVRKAAASTFND
jgi:hypothetical protein